MITGQRGSGKSFIINALRQLMHSYCKISSYFGTATFNINGFKLHLLLKLSIKRKNCCELKGQILADLQL